MPLDFKKTIEIDPWLQKWIPLIKNNTREFPLLELGAGHGYDTFLLIEKKINVIATDISLRRLSYLLKTMPYAQPILFDISQKLPFKDKSQAFIIASLSLHYFPWNTTLEISNEIFRILTTNGYLLIRLNSIKDINHGSFGYEEIENDFYQVEKRTKRFFDKKSIFKLFNRKKWSVLYISEYTIYRYPKPKIVWEVMLRKMTIFDNNLTEINILKNIK